MKCHVCNGAGFLEENWLGSGGSKGVLMKCRHCDNDAGYSAEVKRRYSHGYNPDEDKHKQAKVVHLRREK